MRIRVDVGGGAWSPEMKRLETSTAVPTKLFAELAARCFGEMRPEVLMQVYLRDVQGGHLLEPDQTLGACGVGDGHWLELFRGRAKT